MARKHAKLVKVKLQKFVSRGLPDGRMQSLSKGTVLELPERTAESWIGSGVAAKVETDAEKLVRLAKVLDVDLVTTRQDVIDAAHAIRYGTHVRPPG